MTIEETPFKNLLLIKPNLLKDERGFFTRIFCKKIFSKFGFTDDFVQFNQSFNSLKGTIRGIHFQIPPFAEAKLVRCVNGSVFDIAVDLRKDSPTYLKYYGIELNDKNLFCLLIPEGFAHGFQTLEDNSIMLYHHTNFYTPSAESGIRYDDPKLNIQWPEQVTNISNRDLLFPFLNNIK